MQQDACSSAICNIKDMEIMETLQLKEESKEPWALTQCNSMCRLNTEILVQAEIWGNAHNK